MKRKFKCRRQKKTSGNEFFLLTNCKTANLAITHSERYKLAVPVMEARQRQNKPSPIYSPWIRAGPLFFVRQVAATQSNFVTTVTEQERCVFSLFGVF